MAFFKLQALMGLVALKIVERDIAELPLHKKLEVLNHSSRFAHLGESELRKLAALTTTRRFKKKDMIFREEDLPKFFYIVQHGRVKLFRRSFSGKDFIVFIAAPSNLLDPKALFEGKAHDLSAQAMDDVTVLCIKREEYLSFVNEHPSIAVKSIVMLAKVLNSAYERIIDLIGERVEQRVYNILIMLYSKFGTTLLFTREERATLHTICSAFSKLCCQSNIESPKKGGRVNNSPPFIS